MVHAAKLAELADGLITSVTGKTASNEVLKNRTVRELKDASHARTNPFDIRERVLNRDELAEALQLRLDELPLKSRSLPEILSLFLELSDRPSERAHLEDIADLNTAADAPQQLTWEQIVADDPLDEDGIWNDVERGYHSSGDDLDTDDEAQDDRTTSTKATSVDEKDFAALARLYVRPCKENVLDEVHSMTTRLSSLGPKNSDIVLSELTLLRETFSMLHGLPTFVYAKDSSTGTVTPCQGLNLETTEASTVRDVVTRLAKIGTRLDEVRAFVRSRQNVRYIQSIQSACGSRLINFSSTIAELEQRYVAQSSTAVVSIISVHTQIDTLARPLLHVSDIIRRSQDALALHHTLLDAFYDQACITQETGDHVTLITIVEILLAGLQTYIKPVRDWISTGHLPAIDQEHFFVQESDSGSALGNIWSDRYALRSQADGQVVAPAFMESFVDRVFAMGKERAFVRMLDSHADEMADANLDITGMPDLADVLVSIKANSFLPFNQLLHGVISAWVAKAATGSETASLRHRLFHDHGLGRALIAIPLVFFGQDGTQFQTFACSVLDRMTLARHVWNDRFLLTELAQNSIGSCDGVEAANISVTGIDAEQSQTVTPVTHLIESLKIDYAVTWPIQNVIRAPTLLSHSAVFALILQTYHAKRVLGSEVFTLRTLSSASGEMSSTTSEALRLRFLLLWFVDTFDAYIMATVSAAHGVMSAQMKAADGIDSMAEVWKLYEKQLHVRLLLAPNLGPVKDAVVNILGLSERFSQGWEQWTSSSSSTDEDSHEEARAAQAGSAIVPRLRREFEKALSFTRSGLRSISRAGGEPALEILAERLS